MKKLRTALISLILINCVIFSVSINIQNITDTNIDSTVGDGYGSNWLLVFYLSNCQYCKNALSVLDSISKRQDIDNEDFPLRNFKIGIIECNENNWSCMRFNISRVPYLVSLQNDKMFEFDYYVTEEKLLNFIGEEKSIESGKSIPSVLGYSGIIFKIFEEAVGLINERIQNFIDSYLQWDFKWQTIHTIFLLLSPLLILLGLEFVILTYCCYRKKKTIKQVNPEKLENTEDSLKDEAEKKKIE